MVFFDWRLTGKTVILSLMIWVLPSWTLGQVKQFNLTRLRLPQEVPANSVRRLLIDKKGFVWIFTLNNSFYRFDGHSVTKAEAMLSEGVLAYSTLRPHIDDQNQLWIGDLEKMIRINLNTLTIHPFTLPVTGRWSDKKIADITSDGQTIYLSTEVGQLFAGNAEKGFHQIVDVAKIFGVSSISRLAFFESSLYFTVANQGLFKRDSLGRVVRISISGTDEKQPTNYRWLQSDGTSLFAQDHNGRLVQILKHQAKHVALGQITSDWNLYPLQDGYFVRFLDNQTLILRLVNDQLVVTDRIATSTRHREDKSGLFLRNSLGVYQIGPVQKELFAGNQQLKAFNAQNISIRHIAQHRGTLYLGTYEGFFRVDAKKNARRLTNTIVYTSFADQRGTIWLGTEGGGLKQLTSHDSVRSVEAVNTLGNAYITCIESLDPIRLIVGTYQGFYVFDIRQKKWNRLVFSNDTYQINESKIRKLRKIGNRIYFCGEKGIGFLDTENMTKINTLPGLAPSYSIYDFLLRDSTLWLATARHGLVGYNLTSHKLKSIESRDSLIGKTVFNVLSARNYLVCGTEAGLSLVDLTTRRIKNFTTDDGLPSNEFNQGAQWIDGDTLYLGTIQGVTYFTVADLLTYQRKTTVKPILSSLLITNVSGGINRQIYNLAYQPDSIVPLQASERVLAFRFSTPPELEASPLMYQLNDQSQWIPISGNTLTLAGLGAGLNQLRFRYQQEINESPFQFRIAPFFYETWWFILLLLVLAGLLVYLYIRFQVQRIRAEQAIRTRISSDLHDELGGLLTGISLQADYLMYSENKEQHHQKYLDRIATASKKATSTMSDMVWSIDSRNDDWESLILRMKEFAYTLAETASIQPEFNIEGDLTDKKLHPQVRQNLYLFLKETVHNVCKHAKASRMIISLFVGSQHVVLTIADNGLGLKGHNVSSGQGLSNLRLRAQRLNGTLTFEDRQPGLLVQLQFNPKKLPVGVRKI
ncbi:hypothetical protein IC229_29720 [Spirosoma sp. BT702]|uniref:histidine kinase n=1 Tax=Spirosoma profusum TaxID=2771354 RepID=A0A927AUV7_9BACT|nr:histidine kinase [Spirosoma profusum]MBD2704847.1 hypothetical protein [Spirosoma profusum]